MPLSDEAKKVFIDSAKEYLKEVNLCRRSPLFGNGIVPCPDNTSCSKCVFKTIGLRDVFSTIIASSSLKNVRQRDDYIVSLSTACLYDSYNSDEFDSFDKKRKNEIKKELNKFIVIDGVVFREFNKNSIPEIISILIEAAKNEE